MQPIQILRERAFIYVVLALVTLGCAHRPAPATLELMGVTQAFETGTIIHTASGQAVTFDRMVADMATAQVVFVGERHPDPEHHRIQLQVIQALQSHWNDLQVGLEMFDHTYQDKLDRWSRGDFDYDTLLKETHWYANWRYKDALYQEILMYAKTEQVPLVGLNVPFNLPPKISIGGIATLSDWERRQIPAQIDLTHPQHRAYLQEIFNQHHGKGGRDFENFYAAQCVWEDGMAQAIANRLSQGPMVVVVGNGHIQYKYGVPLRMHRRTQAPYRTLYLAYPQKEAKPRDLADYVWITPRPEDGFHGRR